MPCAIALPLEDDRSPSAMSHNMGAGVQKPDCPKGTGHPPPLTYIRASARIYIIICTFYEQHFNSGPPTPFFFVAQSALLFIYQHPPSWDPLTISNWVLLIFLSFQDDAYPTLEAPDCCRSAGASFISPFTPTLLRGYIVACSLKPDAAPYGYCKSRTNRRAPSPI